MRTIKKTVTVKVCEAKVYDRDVKKENVIEATLIDTGKNAKVNIPEHCVLLEPVTVKEEKEVTYKLSPEKFFQVAEVEA